MRSLWANLRFAVEMLTVYPILFYPGVVFGLSGVVMLLPFDVPQLRPDFFSAVAQLLPVLLIALFGELVLEARAYEADEETAGRKHDWSEPPDPESPSPREHSRFQRAVAVITTILTSEFSALWELGTAPNSPYLACVCVISVVLAAGALLGPFLHRIRPGGPTGLYGW